MGILSTIGRAVASVLPSQSIEEEEAAVLGMDPNDPGKPQAIARLQARKSALAREQAERRNQKTADTLAKLPAVRSPSSFPEVAAIEDKLAAIATEEQGLEAERALLTARLQGDAAAGTVRGLASEYLKTGELETKPAISPARLSEIAHRLSILREARQQLNMKAIAVRSKVSGDICRDHVDFVRGIVARQVAALVLFARARRDFENLIRKLQNNGVSVTHHPFVGTQLHDGVPLIRVGRTNWGTAAGTDFGDVDFEPGSHLDEWIKRLVQTNLLDGAPTAAEAAKLVEASKIELPAMSDQTAAAATWIGNPAQASAPAPAEPAQQPHQPTRPGRRGKRDDGNPAETATLPPLPNSW